MNKKEIYQAHYEEQNNPSKKCGIGVDKEGRLLSFLFRYYDWSIGENVIYGYDGTGLRLFKGGRKGWIKGLL